MNKSKLKSHIVLFGRKKDLRISEEKKPEIIFKT
jgi:hypothetical protein